VEIVVFGAGAVGAFFGGLLVRGGQEVSFIARGAQLDALRTRGILIRSLRLGEVAIPRVQAFGRAAEVLSGQAARRPDLVLVCVKANQTAAILEDLATLLGPTSTVVTLQNGVDSDDTIAERFGRARVIPAVVYVGATIDSPGVVTHVAAGTIAIGVRTGGDAARLPAIRDALAASGQPIRISDDIQRERWQKLIWNASFNTVSAITGRTPRELLAVEEARATILGIMREVIAVGRASGLSLVDSDADDQIAWTERATAIRTSMMVDRERHRAMETEALIGVIVRAGREHGVPTPVSDTVYGLLEAIESETLPEVSASWVPPPRQSG
jgi:2-dehydropantoate 2-reductase